MLLGQQLIDDEGYLLYYQIDPENPNLPKITRDINEATISIHDFQTIEEDEERLQLIQSRLRTENPDWYLYEEIGASLTDFIGLPNNPDTANAVEERVRETLTRNDAFSEDEMTINIVPISTNEILVDVMLDSESRYLRYAFSLNFDVGVNNAYVLDADGNILDEEHQENPDVYEGIPAYEEDFQEEGDGENAFEDEGGMF